MAQNEPNSLEAIKLALERRQFADIMTASEKIQSRLVMKVPLIEPDCALLAGALFARSAALIRYREYCESLLTAQRAIRTMCVLGPEPELIDMIHTAVNADLGGLATLKEARASVEEWLRSASPHTQKQKALEQSLAALTRCEPLQCATAIVLMQDLVELVEEWAGISAERAKRERDGGEPTDIKPAYYATAAGFAKRTTCLNVVRSRGPISDRPPTSVSVGVGNEE